MEKIRIHKSAREIEVMRYRQKAVVGNHTDDRLRIGCQCGVAKLSDGQRQALVLRFSEGLSYEEIANALECPLGTVKSRIFHGLLSLRRVLEEEGEDARSLPMFPQEGTGAQEGTAHAV